MAEYDIAGHSGALRADQTLQTLYRIIIGYGNREAAVWLENGAEKTLTFTDYERLTRNYAAELRRAVGAEKGAWVGIAMDTCKEWFPVFWGLLQAGYNALLLDASLSDEMTNYLLGQANARALVTTKTRKLAGDTRLIDAKTLFTAPEAPESFAPDWADNVALCTSGTTGTSRIFVYNGRAVSAFTDTQEVLASIPPGNYGEQTFVLTDADNMIADLTGEPLSVLDALETGRQMHSWSLEDSLRYIHAQQRGVVVLLNCGETAQQLLAQFDGTAESSHAPGKGLDLRSYGIGAQILRECGVRKLIILGTPRRMPSMVGYDLEVTGFTPAPPQA